MSKGGDLPQEKRRNTEVCSVEEIKQLNETKQYTLMATGLLQLIVTDKNLTSSAAKLWEYLYSKAILNENLCVKITYRDLAKVFDRSERTLKRAIENLKENGYLSVESNFYQRAQQANTFYIRFPKTTLDTLKSAKNRKKSSENTDKYVNDDLTFTSTNQVALRTDTPQQKTEEQTNVLPMATFSNEDKIVIPAGDINDTPINNIKKDIIINNNVVRDLSSKQEKSLERNNPLLANDINIDEIVVLRGTSAGSPKKDEEIAEIERKINSLYIQLGSANNDEKPTIFEAIKHLRAIVSTIEVESVRQEQLLKILSSKKQDTTLDPSLNFLQIKNQRTLSNMDISRITKMVTALIPSPIDQKRTFNEIIYAIRFGSLQVSQNGKELSTSHATSIAIKLLRENRWQTPIPLQKKSYLPNASHFKNLKDRLIFSSMRA